MYSHSMGIFSKSTNSSGKNSEIVHTATWPQNSVKITMTKSGLSISSNKPFQMMDETMCEAAIAQLERAYHRDISYPNAEEQVMAFWSSVSPDVSSGSKIDFNWRPPLPS